jgi:hypothetical protein
MSKLFLKELFMKRLIGIGILVLVVFFGCDAFGSIFNPVIGDWEATVVGVTTTNMHHADGTCSETSSLLGIGVSKTGTWESDGTLLTRTWSGDSPEVLYYTFSSNKKQMTLSSAPGGVSVTYTRM